MKFTLFLLSLLIYPVLCGAQEIKFVTHSTGQETFIDESGELRGKPHAGKRAFVIELVRALKQDTIYRDSPTALVPLKRILTKLLPKEGYAAFNIARTTARVHNYKWVGPLQTDQLYFYRLKNSNTAPVSLSDVKNNYLTCVKNGGHHHKHLKSLGFTSLEVVNDYAHCFKMLAAKRTDLAILSKWSLASTLALSEINKDSIEEALLYKEINGYIAFSLSTSDRLIKQWQNKLDQLKRNGTYQSLKEQYLLR